MLLGFLLFFRFARISSSKFFRELRDICDREEGDSFLRFELGIGGIVDFGKSEFDCFVDSFFERENVFYESSEGNFSKKKFFVQ